MRSLKFLYGVAAGFATVMLILVVCCSGKHRILDMYEYILFFMSAGGLIFTFGSFFTKDFENSACIGCIASVIYLSALGILITRCVLTNLTFNGLVMGYLFCLFGCSFAQVIHSFMYLAGLGFKAFPAEKPVTV